MIRFVIIAAAAAATITACTTEQTDTAHGVTYVDVASAETAD